MWVSVGVCGGEGVVMMAACVMVCMCLWVPMSQDDLE